MPENLRTAESETKCCEYCKRFYAHFVKLSWLGKYPVNGRCYDKESRLFYYAADYMVCDLFERGD